LSPLPRPLTARIVLIACLALACGACGEPSEKRAPLYSASGTVTYQGKPLPGAFILFRKLKPDPDVPSPTATTGEDGSFDLTTYESKDGAPAGDYVVAISTAPMTVVEKKVSLKKSERPVDLLKGRYADLKTSGLKATIKPTSNTLEPFALNDSGGADSATTAPVSSKGRDR
jgi:hypothetical protein